MAMKKLSVNLQCIITSSLQINNFKRVVEELVYNSLDAKATSIAVRINIAENKIQVVDNGCGITEADFDLLGNKHSTSKCVDLNTLKSVPHTYGYRGQFLANLINIAQKVKITSRFEKGEDTWVKIFYNGKERELAKTNTRPSVGTTVEVSNLFYNLHIQSKNMEPLHELSEIKTLLKQLTLVHNNISISLRDDSKNEIIFKAHKNRNIYQTFGLLFNIDEKDIAEFKVEKKEYKVTAYFGKKDTKVGQYHWIYLNGKFLNNCKLHKIVNDNLSKSCKHISKRKIKSKVCEEEDIFTTRTIPFYIILLSCPYYDYDINDVSKLTTLEFKNWEDITNLLKKLVNFYCGDDTAKKQLKNETVKTNSTKTKDDDKRDRVRKIVEKLLKSNSKKLGISQMQNGIKGKLTKRNKKKKKPLNISLSKVIPSKNKIPRNQNELSKDKSKKISLNEEIVPDSNKIKNVFIENIEKENDMQEDDQIITINNVSKQNLEFMDIESEETTKRQKKEQRNSNQKYNVSLKYSRRLKERYKTFRKLENKKRSRNKIPLVDDSIKVMSPSNDMCESREMKLTKPDIIQNKHNKNYINYTGDNLHLNDLTNIYNINTNNNQITIRKNIEKIVVYDYIPHPLNSYQQSDRHQNKFMKKPHISSRDLVKTVLNTQYNNASTNENQISYHYKESADPKKSEIYLDIAKDLAASLDIEHNRMMNPKNTRESAFNAWKFDLQPDSNNMNKVADDELFISKITYESHHYNKNVCFDNSHKTKTRKFISKQSKDNFIFSKEKQKIKKSYNDKFKYLPKINFHDVNMTFGLKNFFKNRNFLQESSFMIEFSNTAVKDRSHESTYTRNSRNIFCTDNNQVNYMNSNKYMQKSNIDEDFVKGYSVNTNTEFKNTYTISENSLNPNGEYNPPYKNYESIRYTENVSHGTYTIETHDDEDLYHWKNNENKEDARNDKDELNVIFVSEPQIEIVELSADKKVEPIDVCETILNESYSPKSLSDMEIDLNNDIAPQWPNPKQEQHIETPKISQREVSHHFNTSISNINYTTARNVLCNSYIEIDAKNHNLVDNNDIGDTIANNDNINFKSTILKNLHNDSDFQNVSKETISNNFSIKIRPRYMPKGMSQIFENSNTKGVCDYKLDEDYYKCNIYEDFTKEIKINTEIFKPRVQNAKEDATTHAIGKVNLKLHKEKSALTFDGQLLKQAQILEQVDGKFIAAIVKSKSESNDFLVLFDQHAVHERIRLENNMADYFNEQEWRSVQLDVFTLKLSKEEILYLHNYKEKFTQLGLEWNILSDYEVSVFGIPEAILGKNPRQVDKVITAVKNLIIEEINVIKSQGGCICLHPKSIMDLVFSEACRYAVKFGDKLTINDCRELIQFLSDCRTPFQCAHGRPVMAVLMEMTSCDVQEYKVEISKIRAFSETKRKQTVQDIQ